jgi:hypothetical protein
MNAEYLEKVLTLARRFRSTNDMVDGIQFILVGDFFQLPPVDTEMYLFESQIWAKLNLQCRNLKSQFRQMDNRYYKSK